MNRNEVVPGTMTDVDAATPRVVLIPLDDLEPDPDQGRKRFDAAALEGLAKSIRECGVLEPILVQPRNEDSKHRIIAGERRWRAARVAGLAAVPCMVRDGARPALEQLVENFQREDLDPIAKAEQLRRTMMQTGMDAREVAARAGLGYPTVLSYLRLADGPEILRKAVTVGLRVEVEDENVTRVLEWTHALEALRIYRTVFEPADRSEKKKKAQIRLDALLRRALAEDWNRKRWLACAVAIAKERTGPRGAANGASQEAAGESCATADAPGPRAAEEHPPSATVAAHHRTEGDAVEPRLGADELLAIVDRVLATASSPALEAAAARVEEAIAAARPGILYCRREHQLIVYLDRLTPDADAAKRAELITEVDAVLGSVRRIRTASSGSR